MLDLKALFELVKENMSEFVKGMFYLLIFLYILISLMSGLINWINPFDITGAKANELEINSLNDKYGSLINDSSSLINKSKKYYQDQVPEIRGKILVCDLSSKKVNEIQTEIRPELRLTSTDDVYISISDNHFVNSISERDRILGNMTLIFIKNYDGIVGKYSDGSLAIQHLANVYLLYLNLLASSDHYHIYNRDSRLYTLRGSEPPSTKYGSISGTGGDVTPVVIEWINGLHPQN